MKNTSKFILVLAAVLVFGGCFWSDKKKTEINFDTEEETNQPVEEYNLEGNSNETSEAQSPAEDTAESFIEYSTAEEEAAEESEEVSAPKITNRLVGWGFQKSSGRKIDTIVVHSSYNAVGNDVHDLDDIIEKEYKPYGVSPHYIIDRKGKIYRLVEDKNIAYHAGTSSVPDGRTNVNNFSVGIEIVNTKEESPNRDQYESLSDLISYLKGKYNIKYILGHSDIAPGRKTDPWNFSWSKIGGKMK